ncbi:MAG: hypothetical protein AB1805_02505 [Nitrospirota bacterium]
MAHTYEWKRTRLQSAYRTEGKSCKDLIGDRERLDRIEHEIRRAEEMLQEAERLRKEGLGVKKKAEAEKRRELAVQEATRRFAATNEEFIEENGRNAAVVRVREGSIAGMAFIVITGEASSKQFQVFYRVD